MEYLILNFLKAQAVNRINSELIVTVNKAGVYWVQASKVQRCLTIRINKDKLQYKRFW